GGLAALAMLALALITFIDVWARYAFNAPIPGAYELTELTMGVMIFAALPVITWRGSHITIDLLDHVTPAWLALWGGALVQALSALVLAGLAAELWSLAMTMKGYGDVTEYLRIPIHPVVQLMSLLAWFTCALSLAALALTLAGALRRSS
ncbi:MAG: TRAP transporter small permease, partial [Alphaproteobacteria bacterium]|nr:TRAP transporter small permease [Alphaproteobacteria bacterium]